MNKMNVLKPNGEFVTINGHKIHVYRTGNVNGPKLVFMAGSGTVSPVYDFKLLYQKLSEKFRIIVVEKLGYGYSDICEAAGDIDSLVSVQKQALDMLDEKGPFILLPHSMGGLEALRWSQLYPDDVKALIGIDMATPISYNRWTDADVNKRKKLLTTLKKFKLYKLSTASFNDSLDDVEKAQLRLLQKRNAFNECYGCEADNVKKNAAIVGESDYKKIPTLLFCSNGKQTFKNWLEDQKEFAGIMNANLISYDCGHYIHHYKSEEMSSEIEKFVSQL